MTEGDPEERGGERGASPVDCHVGARIRMRRKLLGHSQQDLAQSLGLTFQQVQKYERGANRVSSSKLYDIARFLQVPVQYFFDGLPDPVSEQSPGARGNGVEEDVRAFLNSREGLQIAIAFPRIPQPALRRAILELVLAGAQDAEADKAQDPKEARAAGRH